MGLADPKRYGDDIWRELYQDSFQGNLFDTKEVKREAGIKGLRDIYMRQRQAALGARHMNKSRVLMSTTIHHYLS